MKNGIIKIIFGAILLMIPQRLLADDSPSVSNPRLLIREADMDPNQRISVLQVPNGSLAVSGSTGIVSFSGSSLGSGSTNYIQNRITLQSGSTFFVDKGIATDLVVNSSASVGTDTPIEKLHVVGNTYTSGQFIEGVGSYSQTSPFVLASSVKSSDFTADQNATVYFCNASVGNISVTLPSAVGAQNRVYHFIKTDSTLNRVILNPQSGETVGYESSFELFLRGESISIISDNSVWVGF